ncbi:MAG: glycosyltransferase family 2 protein [Chloroflexota bacterium]
MVQQPLFSVIGPVWNEEGNLQEFYDQIKLTLDATQDAWELILINDGSSDRSLEILQALHQQDQRVKVIDFAKNFGQEAAITAGLDFALGKAVILMDTDLQDPPSLLPQLIEKWREGYEVIYAVRAERKGESIFKKATASVFYRMIQSITSIYIPPDTGNFRLIDRKVVDTIKQMREHHRFIRGMTSWVGFRQTGVEYIRHERFSGDTGYPVRAMLKLAISAITGFSSIPLQLATFAGFLIAGLSAIAMIIVIYGRLFLASEAFLGQATTLVVVLFMGGVQLITLGIIGEYLSRVYDEVRGRPLYIVKKTEGISVEKSLKVSSLS